MRDKIGTRANVHDRSGDSDTRSQSATNALKDLDDRASGDDPMTGAQASYLKTLSNEMDLPDAFERGIDETEASHRIDELKGRLNAPC